MMQNELSSNLKPSVFPVSDTEAYDPILYPPPKGAKLNLITKYGLQEVGTYKKGYHIGWYPLLKIPETVKVRRKLYSTNYQSIPMNISEDVNGSLIITYIDTFTLEKIHESKLHYHGSIEELRKKYLSNTVNILKDFDPGILDMFNILWRPDKLIDLITEEEYDY